MVCYLEKSCRSSLMRTRIVASSSRALAASVRTLEERVKEGKLDVAEKARIQSLRWDTLLVEGLKEMLRNSETELQKKIDEGTDTRGVEQDIALVEGKIASVWYKNDDKELKKIQEANPSLGIEEVTEKLERIWEEASPTAKTNYYKSKVDEFAQDKGEDTPEPAPEEEEDTQ